MLLWGMLTHFSSCIFQATTVFKYVVCIDFLKKIQIRVQKISFARKKREKDVLAGDCRRRHDGNPHQQHWLPWRRRCREREAVRL